MAMARPPIPLTGPADSQVLGRAKFANRIHVFKLVAMVAAIHLLLSELLGRKLILSVGNGASCAASAKGTAEDDVALNLLLSL